MEQMSIVLALYFEFIIHHIYALRAIWMQMLLLFAWRAENSWMQVTVTGM